MAIKELMHSIHLWLEEEHFVNQVRESEELPPMIAVILGPDARQRDRTLTILTRFQETGEKEPLIIALEFIAEMPIAVQPRSAKEIASLLHFINNELYLTGFHFDEAESKVLFRHINYSLSSGIEKKVLIGIVGLILFYLDLYANAIEDVATSKKTFNQFVEEIVAGSKALI